MADSLESALKHNIAGLCLRARLFFWLKKLIISLGSFLFCFHVGFFVMALSISLVCLFVSPLHSSLELQRLVENHYRPVRNDFIKLAHIPDFARQMIIKLEDRNFYRHHGIEPSAIINAFEQNARYGKIVLGGSTITQQVVRTLFLYPQKTYFRKYLEILWALILDAILPKERILELYFNYIEWGKGIYGLAAAAKVQFGKPYSSLSYEEYARLTAIIINPLDYDVKTFFKHQAMQLRYQSLMGKAAQEDNDNKTELRDQTKLLEQEIEEIDATEKRAEPEPLKDDESGLNNEEQGE